MVIQNKYAYGYRYDGRGNVMADKYHEYTTCNDVCNSIRSVFKRYNLGKYDTETQNIISYYQNLSDSILLKKK